MQFRISCRREKGKEIPNSSRLEFLKKILVNNFALSDAKNNTSWEPSLWEVMDSVGLLAYASLAVSRTFLQQLLAGLNFTLDSEDLFCCYKWKKWFPWTMVAAQAAENHGDEWGLTWYLQWWIYTSIPTWTHSQRSLAAAEALSIKISSHETSLKWTQRLSQSAWE